jgi:hypothetical protein
MKQDIRIGNLTHTALGEISISNRQAYSRGTLGRSREGNGTSMIQYARWSIQLNNVIVLGLQVEHKFFTGQQKINYVEYYMNTTGRDIYNCSQSGAAIIAGFVL